MQPLAWTRTGRKYTHADEGQPNKFTLALKVGQRNVDVNGDGSLYAPYVLNGTFLRHGDSECEFTDGWQVLKRLGQTLVSKSRLYIQRDVDGTWTDVPHGVPTRNVLHDYPQEGCCTAYLDFPEIQGYAQGARLQVGVEVGGSDQEIYGFRFRSPVDGTFRLEWVLEIPQDVDLAWIDQPVDHHDPEGATIRIGGRIGTVNFFWTPEEAPNRTVTVVPDGVGGRVVHVFLGPYTVTAMEWLTIYPDTVTGDLADATDDGSQEENNTVIYGEVYMGSWGGYRSIAAWSFPLGGDVPVPAGASVSEAYLRARCILACNGSYDYRFLIENIHPNSAWIWTNSTAVNTPHFPTVSIASGMAYTSGIAHTGSFYANSWYFGKTDHSPYNLSTGIQTLVNSFAPFTGRLNIILRPDSVGGNFEGQFRAAVNTDEAQFTITYTQQTGHPAIKRWGGIPYVGVNKGVW